jgi:hypothetical protein
VTREPREPRERALPLDDWSVRAILQGKKTRHTLPVRPPLDPGRHAPFVGLDGRWRWMAGMVSHVDDERFSPFGAPGDVLWVREQFAARSDVDPATEPEKAIHYLHHRASYKGDIADEFHAYGGWQRSTHMPRWASRLRLRVTDLKLQRVREITEDDALAEGYDVRWLGEFVRPLEVKAKAKSLYWVGGGDEGESYCLNCCRKAVATAKEVNPDGEYQVDGGWLQEADGQPFCAKCGCLLDCTYTTDGIEEELAGLEESGIQTPEEGYVAANVIGIHGNPWLTESCGEFQHHPEWTGRIARLAFRARWDHLYARKGMGWEKDPWAFVATFERVEV